MANDPAELVQWTIESSQGTAILDLIQDYSVKSEGKVKTLNGCGFDVPRGFVRTPGALTIGLTGTMLKGKPQVDFRKLERTGEKIKLTKHIKSGKSEQFFPVRVSTYDEDGDADGKNEFKLEVVAFDSVTM